PHALLQVVSSDTIWLDLYADSIAFRRALARKRVTAKNRCAAGARLKTQDHVLPRQSRWQGLTVRALHCQRDHVCRLLIDRRHLEPPKSRCNGMGCRGWHQSRVSTISRHGFFALE